MPFRSLTAPSAWPLICGSYGTDPSQLAVTPSEFLRTVATLDHPRERRLVVAPDDDTRVAQPHNVLLEPVNDESVRIYSLLRDHMREDTPCGRTLHHYDSTRAIALAFWKLVTSCTPPVESACLRPQGRGGRALAQNLQHTPDTNSGMGDGRLYVCRSQPATVRGASEVPCVV